MSSQSRRGPGTLGRSIAATVLLLLGTVLALEGVIFLWADDTVFNTGHFAATAVDAAKAPPVKTEISRVLVDQAVKIQPDLVTVRPLLETVIETIIATPVFRRILVSAVSDLHRSVFQSSQRTLALDLSNGLTVAIGGLRVINPKLADQIPPDVKTGLIKFGSRGYTADVSQSLDRLHLAMLALGLAGVVLLVAAVAVSPNRRATIVAIGVALTVGALLLFLGLGVARQLLVRQITTDSTAAAVGSIFDTLTRRLTAYLWIAGIGGIVLAAAASASLRTASARDQVEALRRLVTRLPERRWLQVVYALVAAALGLALVAAPGLVLGLLARAAGLLVLYIAGTALLRLSGLAARAAPVPPIGERTRAERVRRLRGSLIVRLAAGGALVVAVFIAVTALYLNRSNLSAGDVAEAAGPQRCNGFVELCDRPLNQVAFAATHNSQSAADVSGFYFAEQLHGLRSQLDAGVRGLLVKSHYGIDTKKGVLTDLSRETEQEHTELVANLGPEGEAAVERLQASFGQPAKGAESDAYLCHGFCELGAVYLDDALTDINTFLDDNENEVIIIFIGDYVSPADTEDAFIRTGLIDRVYTHQPGSPWPTLRQMIDLDQRVLVLSEHAGGMTRPDWYHDGFSLAQDTPYTFSSPDALQTDASCALNRGTAAAPLFLINHWIESQTPSPVTAETVNGYDVLLGRVRRCQALRGAFPNLIAVDFAEKGDLLRVVNTLNGVGDQAPAGTSQTPAPTTGTPGAGPTATP